MECATFARRNGSAPEFPLAAAGTMEFAVFRHPPISGSTNIARGVVAALHESGGCSQPPLDSIQELPV
jgi:hypothetical protein